MKLDLTRQGFIKNWLVTQPVESSINKVEQIEKHQIKFEQFLRYIGVDQEHKQPPIDVRIGNVTDIGSKWEYYNAGNNWFVDFKYGTKTPMRLESYAYTQLLLTEKMSLDFSVWSYPAVEIWIDDELIYHMDRAVYKPMVEGRFSKSLSKGCHNIFVRLQNVSIRDTRNIFGIQIHNGENKVHVHLPGGEEISDLVRAEEVLNGLNLHGGLLILKQDLQWPLYIVSNNKRLEIKGKEVMVPEDIIRFTVCIDTPLQTLGRNFEISDRYKAGYNPEENMEEVYRKTYESISRIPSAFRGGDVHFSVYHVLARYAMNMQTDEDDKLILGDLQHINDRVDCSDFLVVGLIRLLQKYKLKEHVREAIKRTLINFRYWMDESGVDGMCFWSENHSLMFCGSQMIVGTMFPDQVFPRSNRRGEEQAELGRLRCLEWLHEVEVNGFEEFASASYTNVTVAALLNVIDFGPEDISIRAQKLMDKLMEQLVDHLFDGVLIAPQGRVYRDVIYPFKQSCQGLIYLLSSDFVSILDKGGVESMWLACFATSKYSLPSHMVKHLKRDLEKVYKSGDATISIKKNKDYILTSVESYKRKVNNHIQTSEPFTMPWVKEMNIRYHGRTLFEPGVYGYQQHLWYGALANDCVVFVNHPGETADDRGMRPGYWYGNGILPALKQVGNILGSIYHLTDKHPISFTHVYWPQRQFDKVLKEGQWLFGKKGNGYIGLWCSSELEAFNDVLSEREYRCYSDKVAYVCVCGSVMEDGDFQSFIEKTKGLAMAFDPTTLQLSVDEYLKISYEEAEDNSQYI